VAVADNSTLKTTDTNKSPYETFYKGIFNIYVIGVILIYQNIKGLTMSKDDLLWIDAFINFSLGILLLLVIPFPDYIPNLLGVPEINHPFYPSIMGGVFIGIGFALLIETGDNKFHNLGGLGLGGAAIINVCGGLVLFGWLLAGKLELPPTGKLFLWGIVMILCCISTIEIIVYRKQGNNTHQR
jgi:hypothetical protein